MSIEMNAESTERTADESAVEARVEAARAWTPKEKVRFWKQTVVMFLEMVAEAKWRTAVFCDLFDDVSPAGCGDDCSRESGRSCARCLAADQLSYQDRLTKEICRFVNWDEDLWGSVGDEVPDPDGDHELWEELERRLAKAPKTARGRLSGGLDPDLCHWLKSRRPKNAGP